MDKPSKGTQKLINVVSNLKDRGLKEEHILRTWEERRIHPLAAQASPMYAYTGPGDPTWVTAEELTEDEVRTSIHVLTDLPLNKIPFDVVVELFHYGNAPDDVSLLSLSL